MNGYNQYLGSTKTPSIQGGILKGSLPGQGVESRWQTPLLDHLQLYGRLISADARNRIFVMKLFSLGSVFWESSVKLEIPIIHQWGRCIKVAWEHQQKHDPFFCGGVLWEEIVGYHLCKKKSAALICTQKDQAEIYKVEDD